MAQLLRSFCDTDAHLYSNTVEKGSVDVIEDRVICLHRTHQSRQLLRH